MTGNAWGAAEDSLAVTGGNPGDVFVREGGAEYNGLSVKLLARSYPLFTKQSVDRIIELVTDDNIIGVLNYIGLNSVEELEYALYKWAQVAIPTPMNIQPTREYPELDPSILRQRSDAISVPIEVVDVGHNTQTQGPAVPESWLGRTFENGTVMHRAMDEHRPGRPQTTYAVIYNMKRFEQPLIMEARDVIFRDDSIVWIIDDQLHAQVFEGSQVPDTPYNYLRLRQGTDGVPDEWVGFNLDRIFVRSSQTDKDEDRLHQESTRSSMTDRLHQESSGVLSSMLQKCIRRGDVELVEDVLRSLNDKPNYNLPDMGFKRVSSPRQVVWRLFVSSMEDVTIYRPSPGVVNMESLILLSLISQILLEYKFSPRSMEYIIRTAQRLCVTPTHTPYQLIRGSQESNGHQGIRLALDYMPMMSGDRQMMQSYLKLNPTQYVQLNSLEDSDIADVDTRDVILSSFDNHCKPNIILIFQSLLPTVMTTRQVSAWIWNNSSSINYRLGQVVDLSDPMMIKLRQIQEVVYWNRLPNVKSTSNSTDSSASQVEPRVLGLSESDKRETFLILYGIPFKYNNVEYMLAGTESAPIKFKDRVRGADRSSMHWIYTSDTSMLDTLEPRTVDLSSIRPPLGYTWIHDSITATYRDGEFVASWPGGEVILPLFDGSNILVSNAPPIPDMDAANETILTTSEHSIESLVEYRTRTSDTLDYFYPGQWNDELVILTYTKLFNRMTDKVTVGPVDRAGNRTESSINLQYEGRLWYIFSYLSWLYPDAIGLSGSIRFKVNVMSPQYVLLIESLREMLYYSDETLLSQSSPSNQLSPSGDIRNVVEILTPLWEHQQNSVDTMYSKFVNDGVHGMGDASDVGSGKTLTALSLGARLISNIDATRGHRGILVLVPNKSLLDTWTTEIQSHTIGYDVRLHTAKSKVTGSIDRNTIVISALNTIRDHPIHNPWILTVIDECLSVQNSSAQWTEEAWKQTLISYGVVLLSATFFRSRYNKLYYMLSMLQSNIPTTIDYLPTILNERIIVHKEIGSNRTWHTRSNYLPFPENIRDRYDDILYSDSDDQIRHGLLQQLLNTQRPYVADQIQQILDDYPDDRKVLIYASGEQEARIFSNHLNIPIYGTPGVIPADNRHIIATVNKASVGVNDLISFNTILLRPPPPDLLPQMKGRLDRPGQQSLDLYIDYFMIDHSIDLGLELRLNIANNFLSAYIMPMAEFYDISLRASQTS